MPQYDLNTQLFGVVVLNVTDAFAVNITNPTSEKYTNYEYSYYGDDQTDSLPSMQITYNIYVNFGSEDKYTSATEAYVG